MSSDSLRGMVSGHFFVGVSFVLLAGLVSAQDIATITVVGVKGKIVTLSVADLQALTPRAVEATDPHSKEKAAYQVVPLSKVLAMADVPFGTLLKGPFLASTVRADARDGYRVAFSLVELDSTIASSEVFIAFQVDGKPLPAEVGPFRLIVPTDKRGSRWIRQLSRITLIEAGPTNWAATRTADRPDFR